MQSSEREKDKAESAPSTPDEARDQAAAQAEKGVQAAFMAILVSAALGTVKIVSGTLGHSYALIADGVESLLDIVTSLAVLGGLKIAATDPNHRFPYGYGKAEALIGILIAAGLLVVAAILAVQSVREILQPQRGPEWFTLPVLLIVVAAKEVLFRRLARTSDEIGSSAVESDAWHHRSDALTSLAAAVGIGIGIFGGPGYESADDWAALVACGLIAFNGVRVMRGAVPEVLDAAPEDGTLQEIRRVATRIPGVSRIEKCRARKSGLGWLVDLHVEVNGDLPVREGHRLAHEVKAALLAADLSILDALVHIEPEGES